MSDPYLYSVSNAVATFSINDAPVSANRGSKNALEGMQAFMEKRKPVFNQDS